MIFQTVKEKLYPRSTAASHTHVHVHEARVEKSAPTAKAFRM